MNDNNLLKDFKSLEIKFDDLQYKFDMLQFNYNEQEKKYNEIWADLERRISLLEGAYRYSPSDFITNTGNTLY